jgi:protein-disulfide isomerase
MSQSESGDEPNPRPVERPIERGQRREAARQKARLSRRKQKRRARTGRFFLQGGLAIVLIAIVVGVVLVIRGLNGPVGPGPANMAGDGITIGKGFKAVQTDPVAASVTPTATSSTAAADTVDIAVYYDYLCPVCGSFEKTNNEYIRGLVKSGAATVSYHPIAILSNQSLGTKYSNRAANAAACVANDSPDSFFDFNTALFAKQPKEGTAGLTDPQLISVAKGVDGMANTSRISKCITDQTYKSWVTSATQRALDGPIAGTDVAKISSTPTVLVNGQLYKYSTPFTTDEFSNFIVTAAGNTFATASPTPTPTPSRTPTPTP